MLGFALAAVTTSAKLLNGRDGCVHSTFGAVPISSTGSRSFTVSNVMFSRNGLTAWVSNTNTQLLPSGGDFATAPVPTLPEAPGRFSTMTVAPSFCCRPGCAMRAIGSTVPPGGNGTTMRMVPDGQAAAGPWAWASALVWPASGAAKAPSTNRRRENGMISPLVFIGLTSAYNSPERRQAAGRRTGGEGQR